MKKLAKVLMEKCLIKKRRLKMKNLVKIIIVAALVTLVSQTVWAASWNYHPNLLHNPPHYTNEGTLTVWGTIDCVKQEPPLFTGHVQTCYDYSGYVPSWANDYSTKLVQDGCGNTYTSKVDVPRVIPCTGWEFLDLDDWLNNNLTGPVVIPTLGDYSGQILEVYSFVDLPEWLNDPRPLQGEYTVVDGICPDLPGFLIGTTPILFNPYSPCDVYPISTTLLTGTVYLGADITFVPEPATICLLGLGALALLRRRR